MARPDELTIKGNRVAVEDFVSRLTAAGGEWVSDAAAYAVLARIFGHQYPGFRFTHHTRAAGVNAQLRIDPRGAEEWDVTVVPVGRGGHSFSPAETHGLLAKFAAHAAEHARAAGVELVGPGPRPIDLSEYTSPEAAALADEFRTAVASGGFCRDDLARWRAFIVRAYRDGLPPRDVVCDWLAQYGFEGGRIGELVNRYDDTIRVLTEYEQMAARP
jgi:hypothetical protein